MTTPVLARLAGAPISWGVCEVPGWGYQLPVEQVLREMRAVGLSATEFGPDGFLPAPPAERAQTLADAGLDAVGGFVPVVLHDPPADPDRVVAAALDACVATGARTLVLAAATGRDGYDARPSLDRAGWTDLLAALDRLSAVAAERGVTATLHPHVGTMVETADEVDRVLSGCAIPLCLDTGHLLIGGADPAALARDHRTRIAHVHLKDVDAEWADRVQVGTVSYTDAVRDGMYRPLGAGDVDIAGIITSLEAAGYDGWYVLEQDTVLTGPPTDRGPVVDVEASVAYLRTMEPA